MALFNRTASKIVDKAAGATGFGKPTQYHFAQRETPQGGANPYAFDTLALPMYTPIGWGVANKRTFYATRSAPVVNIAHGVPLDSLGNPGTLTGQFVSQPLIDPNAAYGVPMIPDPKRNMLKEGSLS